MSIKIPIIDRKYALAAVNRHGWMLQYVDKHLRRDKEITLAAVKQFGLALQYTDKTLKKDPIVVLSAVGKNRMALQYADKTLRSDKNFILRVVKENGRALEMADEKLRNDKELILAAAVQKHKWPLSYAEPTLWKDRDFVLSEIKKDGSVLECAADFLKKDKEVVLTAVKQNRWAFRYANKALKKDAEVVLAGAREHGWALDAAHKTLWRNKSFVLEVIKKNGDAFRFADKALRSDKNFVLRAAKENRRVLNYVDNSLKKEKEIILAALKKYGRTFDFSSKPQKHNEIIGGVSLEELLKDYSRRIIVSWSGGKDSCLSLHRTLKKKNNKLVYILSCISKESSNVSFHEIEPCLLKAQTELLKVPYLEKITTPDGYQEEYKEALKSLIIPFGIDALVFGNIYNEEHKTWVENVCEDVGINDIQPIWNENTDDLIKEILNSGFEVYIICANADLIDKFWAGRKIDNKFLDYVKNKRIDPCGEYGEFHTFVTSGPILRGKIKFKDTRVVKKNNYWVLNINKYQILSR